MGAGARLVPSVRCPLVCQVPVRTGGRDGIGHARAAGGMTSLALPPDQLLSQRLAALGLETTRQIRTHSNRTVMVSVTEKIHGTNFRAGWVKYDCNTWWKKIKRFFDIMPEYELIAWGKLKKDTLATMRNDGRLPYSFMDQHHRFYFLRHFSLLSVSYLFLLLNYTTDC